MEKNFRPSASGIADGMLVHSRETLAPVTPIRLHEVASERTDDLVHVSKSNDSIDGLWLAARRMTRGEFRMHVRTMMHIMGGVSDE